MGTRTIRLAALGAALALLLAGCSLAQPEREEEEAWEDRFVGVYVVFDPAGSYDGFYSNPNLTEYGSEALDAGEYGTFDVPRQVLWGEEDPDTGRFVFPGLEGWSLFILTQPDGEFGVVSMVSDMAPGEETNSFRFTDEGIENTAYGTLYFGPPADAPADWDAYESPGVWHAYRVYQTADGRPYLDGGGNSYGGGGGMGFTSEDTYTRTENGESRTDRLSVSVQIDSIPRITGLRVVQFREDNTVLQTEELPLTEDLPAVALAEEAAWLVVEEVTGEGTIRALYDRFDLEEGVFHWVPLLNDQGVGAGAQLELTLADPA